MTKNPPQKTKNKTNRQKKTHVDTLRSGVIFPCFRCNSLVPLKGNFCVHTLLAMLYVSFFGNCVYEIIFKF